MPGAIFVGTTMTDHSARSKTLTIGPYNVPLSTIGVPIESVRVVESGPGGVSSMDFVLVDLSIAYVLLEGMEVNFFDVDRQGPIFRGFIQTWSYEPLPVGRRIVIRCTGIDAALDWAMIPSLTIPINTDTTAAIQACWNAAAGLGILLNVTSDSSGPNNGTTTNPLEYMSTFALRYAVVITNQTFRDAVQAVFDATDWNGTQVRAVIWGDMWGGVRANYEEQDIASYHTQDDFTVSMAIYDQSAGVVAGTFTPNDLDYAVDAGAVPHQVYVEGSNAAGSGIVTDGSGLPGPIASLTDDTSDTAEKRNAIGLGYLAELGATVRGSVTLLNHDPVIGPPDGSAVMERAGATVTIDVPRVGASAAEYRIYSITKTFLSNGNEDWVIAFGGQAKSAVRSTRKLTRFVRS